MITSNNRFLQRVNPEITRAVADSGSSLNHSEIQQLARNMVDLGLWGNLKLWVHSGLVKTRTAGADTFVSKAYDISSNDNDAAQATEAAQPKLVSLGMEFDGSNDFLSLPSPGLFTGLVDFSVAFYFSIQTFPANTTNQQGKTLFSAFSEKNFIITFGDGLATNTLGVRRESSVDGWGNPVNFGALSLNTTYFICLTYSSANGWKAYRNSSEITSNAGVGSLGSLYSTAVTMIGYHLSTDLSLSGRYFDGFINDIRVLNCVLSADQITSIYNASKAYYGL